MFSTLTSKISGGLIAILLIICSALYFNKISLEKDIIIKDSTIADIVKERDSLQEERKNNKLLQESADNIAVKKDKERKELENIRDSALSQLDKLDSINTAKELQGNTNGTKTKDAPPPTNLDADTARLLNELCARVKGSTCPNP